MTPRRTSFLRLSCRILTTILLALLMTWAMCAPIVWLVRDGLGPGSVDTVGAKAVFKFLRIWGIPAIALAVPLFVLTRIDRRLTRAVPATYGPPGDGQNSPGLTHKAGEG